MAIKHLTPRSKWEIKWNKFKDSVRKFFKNLPYIFRKKVKFPRIQRVAARTIGEDLVSVQPMPKPIGTSSYLVYQHKEINETKEN